MLSASDCLAKQLTSQESGAPVVEADPPGCKLAILIQRENPALPADTHHTVLPVPLPLQHGMGCRDRPDPERGEPPALTPGRMSFVDVGRTGQQLIGRSLVSRRFGEPDDSLHLLGRDVIGHHQPVISPDIK